MSIFSKKVGGKNSQLRSVPERDTKTVNAFKGTENATSKTKIALQGAFAAIQLAVISVMLLNIYWSIETMNTVAQVEKVAGTLQRDTSSSSGQRANVQQRLAKLENTLLRAEDDLEVLENNPPIAPIEVNGTIYTLAKTGKLMLKT